MSLNLLKSCEPLVLQQCHATTIVKNIVHWHHQRGGEGHCLARAYWHSLDNRLVVLLSELRSNDRVRGMGFDFGDVVNALVICLKNVLGESVFTTTSNICWIAHYGRFSSYDAVGADSFTHVMLTWSGEKFQDGHKEERLTEQQFRALLHGVGIKQLESVYEALAEVGWTRHNG